MYSNSVNYYSYNHRGDVVLITDASGDTTETYEYTAFGEPIASSDNLPDRFIGFSSKEYDVKSGLSYYGFRYYDPQSARWMKKDPIGWDGGINLYGFVHNNPVFYMDTYGNDVTYPAISYVMKDKGRFYEVYYNGDLRDCECDLKDKYTNANNEKDLLCYGTALTIGAIGLTPPTSVPCYILAGVVGGLCLMIDFSYDETKACLETVWEVNERPDLYDLYMADLNKNNPVPIEVEYDHSWIVREYPLSKEQDVIRITQ